MKLKINLILILTAMLLALATFSAFAYGSDVSTLGELLLEYDYTAGGLEYEISTSFFQNVNSSYYDISSSNAEAELDGAYYPVSDISAVIEILFEDSESEFEDVFYRDENGDVSIVEQSEDYYSWGREKILIRTIDGSLPRLIIFLDSSGDSCLLCWETGKGCKLSDGAYDSVKEALGIDVLSEEDSITYSYYPFIDGLTEDIEDEEYEEEETDITNEDAVEDEEENVANVDTNPTTGVVLPLMLSAISLGVALSSKKRN